MILSASQVESFRDDNPFGCRAKWWFEHIDPERVKAPPDGALAIGDAVHKTLEAFLKGEGQGVLHDLVIGAPGALEWLIRLRKRVKHVEVEFGPAKWPLRLGGMDFRGKIDWLADGPLELGDHKTTSVIAKYAKTPGQLKKSVQMNIYARVIRDHVSDNDLPVTQDFYQTKGSKKFLPVSSEISKRENVESILSIEATVEEMVKASTLKDPIHLKPNLKACHIGYGCPHRAYCPHVGVFDMASLLDAFAPEEKPAPAPPAEVVKFEKPVAVLPPDAPASNPVEAAAKILKVDDSSLPTKAEVDAAKEPAPTTTPPLAEPKKGGRPKGSPNKPKAASAAEIAQMQSSVVVPSIPSATFKIKRITIRHEAKVGLPNYSSAGASVECTAEVDGANLEDVSEALSMSVKARMYKELETYKPKEITAVKP